MLVGLKASIARRIYRYLKYHYEEHHSMHERIEQLRRSGMVVGERVAMLDVTLDRVYPWLISIGDDCTLTGCEILTHDESVLLWNGKRQVGPVTIGHHVFIGRGSIVLCNVTIGNNVIVGAGSIVTKDIPDGVVVSGNPARVVGSIQDVISRKDRSGRLIPYYFNSNVIEDWENLRAEPLVREWRESGCREWRKAHQNPVG